jgi:hypothetical protein
MRQLFISYSREDRDFVDGLIRDISDAGFDVWLDREDIRGGTQWRAAITRAIHECSAFLVILSPNSVGSRNVGRELELASDNNRPILPIIYQPCEIPAEFEYHFAGVQRIDFSDKSAREAPLDEVIDALKVLTGTESKKKGGPRSRSAPALESPAPPPPLPNSVWRGVDPQAGVGAQPTPSLLQLLPGRWSLRIKHPFAVVEGSLVLDLAPNGMFQGQLKKPMGMTAIQGQWQATPANQIILQGQETDGLQIAPYGTVIQINQVAPHQLMGVSSGGEQVFWQRIA